MSINTQFFHVCIYVCVYGGGLEQLSLLEYGYKLLAGKQNRKSLNIK